MVTTVNTHTMVLHLLSQEITARALLGQIPTVRLSSRHGSFQWGRICGSQAVTLSLLNQGRHPMDNARTTSPHWAPKSEKTWLGSCFQHLLGNHLTQIHWFSSNSYRWTVLPCILSLHNARSPFFKPSVTTHCAPLGPGDSATYFYFYCSYTPLLVPISVSINYYHNNAVEQASASNFSGTQ